MTFSATDAVFEGFRLIRRKPMVLIWWTLAYLVFFAIMGAIAAAPLSTIFQQVAAFEDTAGPSSWQDIQPLMVAYGTLLALLLPLGLLINAISYSAVARGVLQPSRSAWGYLRLGADEWRVLVVTVVLNLLLMGIYAAAVVATIALVGTGASMQAPWMYLLAALVFLSGLGVLIWLAVRLSLAVPLVIDRKELNLFGSFRLTKGRFWPLLGMGILAWLISFVISMLFGLVVQPAMLLFGPSLESQLAQMQDPAELITLLRQNLPLLGVFLLSNAVSTALVLAVMLAPFSAAYRDLTGSGPSSAPASDGDFNGAL